MDNYLMQQYDNGFHSIEENRVILCNFFWHHTNGKSRISSSITSNKIIINLRNSNPMFIIYISNMEWKCEGSRLSLYN